MSLSKHALLIAAICVFASQTVYAQYTLTSWTPSSCTQSQGSTGSGYGQAQCNMRGYCSAGAPWSQVFVQAVCWGAGCYHSFVVSAGSTANYRGGIVEASCSFTGYQSGFFTEWKNC